MYKHKLLLKTVGNKWDSLCFIYICCSLSKFENEVIINYFFTKLKLNKTACKTFYGQILNLPGYFKNLITNDIN